MPLEFQSLSHGAIAFGFFNIETDLLLLDHYFIFASDFCRYIAELARKAKNDSPTFIWKVYFINNASDIGDLMGAIYGIRYQGFIGEVYKLFPFPRLPEGFKQKPYGFQNRSAVENLLKQFAVEINISVVITADQKKISLGEYAFSRAVFQELLKYVWRGGYPRWQEEKRPDYVWAMKEAIEASDNLLFSGLTFREKE
jgi:hypothetical protein